MLESAAAYPARLIAWRDTLESAAMGENSAISGSSPGPYSTFSARSDRLFGRTAVDPASVFEPPPDSRSFIRSHRDGFRGAGAFFWPLAGCGVFRSGTSPEG